MRYVAVGDSFTEGLGDVRPDGTMRGWADRVAEGMAASLGETIQYANMAVRGRKLVPIMTEQIDAVLALDPLPTMITINGGGNDMLRVTMDVRPAVELTEIAMRRCLDAGIDVVMLSGPDPSNGLPFGRKISARGVALTEAIREMSARYGVPLIDNFTDPETRKPGYWSEDRLHMNATGHQRVAWRVLTGLGFTPPFGEPATPAAPPRSVMVELQYLREHVVPWMQRHLQGRSSGDGRTGKYTTWVDVHPA